tara:strand:- start:1156 stop:1854 length:699 start_codon:yes stop_codon:yes gene_type:complete
MSSVRKRGNECFTRTAKSGATYVVCNDPPKGSRGQVGVYQAENPTGKQDGRTKRKEAEIDKQRAFNRVRKSMMNKTYQKNFGGEASTVDQRTPKSAPATSSMRKDLIDKGTDPKFLDGMGKLYIYTRWANETKQGKSFLKKEKLEKPTKFVDVDDKKYIEEAAGDILDGGGEVEFKEKNIDDFPNRQDGYAFEKGRLSGDERHRMIERTTRYKHYLELAGKTVPDWVKDIAD